MKTNRIISLLLLLPVLFASCSRSLSPEEQSAALEQSEVIARTLQEALGPQLQSALQNGGPVTAIIVCQKIGQPLTRGTSNRFPGATVTRTALRVRNPDNTPDALSRSVLESWTGLQAEGEPIPPADITLEDDQVIIHRPILMGPVCLTCHGDPNTFKADLKEALALHYPEDEATGFQLDELRGAFRIVLERDNL